MQRPALSATARFSPEAGAPGNGFRPSTSIGIEHESAFNQQAPAQRSKRLVAAVP